MFKRINVTFIINWCDLYIYNKVLVFFDFFKAQDCFVLIMSF